MQAGHSSYNVLIRSIPGGVGSLARRASERVREVLSKSGPHQTPTYEARQMARRRRTAGSRAPRENLAGSHALTRRTCSDGIERARRPGRRKKGSRKSLEHGLRERHGTGVIYTLLRRSHHFCLTGAEGWVTPLVGPVRLPLGMNQSSSSSLSSSSSSSPDCSLLKVVG